MAKRILCMLLAAATLFSLAAPAFAEDEPVEEPIVTEEPIEVTEEPIVEAAEEPVMTEEPVIEAEEPVIEAEVPAVEAEEPAVEAEEPVVEAEEPAVEAEEPVVEAEEPVVEAEEPAAEPVPAADIIDSGTCGSEGDGSNLTWTLSGDGTLIISGTGRMAGHVEDINEGPWPEHRLEIKTVVVQDGVTSIGDSMFIECRSLTSVTLPEGLTSIGGYAFCGCWSLTSVTIPASVTSIGEFAFDGCSSLAEVTTLGKETPIDSSWYGPFTNCPALTAIKAPVFSYAHTFAMNNDYQFIPLNPVDSVSGTNGGLTWTLDQAGRLTITGTGAMEDVRTWDDDKEDWSYPWDEYKSMVPITEAVIGEGITSVGSEAFIRCWSLTDVTIPASVTSIGDYAFSGCSSLTSATIPDSVTTIGSWAFAGCGLTDVTIPASVTSIGDYAFSGCSSLTSVAIGDGVTSISGSVFDDCTALTSLTLGKGVTSISYGAFSSCKSLTTISGHAFTYVQTYARENGYQFTPVDPAATVSGKCADQTWTITAAGRFTLTGAGDMWNQPPWTKDYGKYITEAVIGEGITSIGNNAFSQCKYLTSVTIPGTVTSIGSDAFWYCTSLAGVTIPSSVKTIGIYAFGSCTSLTSAALGSGVTEIGESAFSGCKALASVTIPDSVTKIEWSAFYGCASLTSVTIPMGVTEIKSDTFNGCTSLASVTIKNPECKIYDHQSTLGMFGVTVVSGYEGSTAQDYANKYGYPFKSLGMLSKPATPKLSKAENTVDGVKISWKAVSGAAKYKVYYKGGSVKKWKSLATVTNGTSYTWTGAASGTKYTFTVRASNIVGDSGYDKTGKSVTYVAAPTVKVTRTTSGIKVSWNKVKGAGAYRVFYKTSANGKWKTIGDTTATSYTRKNAKLSGGKTYWFTVRCVKAKNSKTYVSSYDSAGKSVLFVKAPTVKVTRTSSGIKISWDKCAGAGAYRVYYKTSKNGKWKAIGNTTKTSYTYRNSKLKNGTTYWFTVKCVKAKNNSTAVSAYNSTGMSIKYKK